MYTKTIENEEYIETIISILNEIENILSIETSVYTFDNNTLITERITTSLRHIVQIGSALSKLIKGQILEAAFKAEKAGPNSTKLFLKIVHSILGDVIRDIKSGVSFSQIEKDLDSFNEEFLEQIKKEIIPAKWNDVVECKSKKISDMTLEAIQLAGLEGTILPSGSPNRKYSVELVTGYNFPVATYPLFTEEDGGRWGRANVRVIVVDGVVEKVSEIHNILNEAHKNKFPYMIVARGYGEEVVATIASNKSLDICPIRIPWELESINYIADISTVCGTDIISSLKGDMLSSIDINSLKIVDKVICTKNNLNIINSKTQKRVSEHVLDLYKKRDNTHIEEMSDFINKRIKALNSHTVHIRLGSENEQKKMKELEAVDFSLRVAKGILEKGTVMVRELGFREKMPTISVLSAVFYSLSLIKSLISVECAILQE